MLVCLGGWAVGILAGYPAPPPYIGRGAETRRPAQLLDPAYPAQTQLGFLNPKLALWCPQGAEVGWKVVKMGLRVSWSIN